MTGSAESPEKPLLHITTNAAWQTALGRGVYEAEPAGGKHSWREVYR